MADLPPIANTGATAGGSGFYPSTSRTGQLGQLSSGVNQQLAGGAAQQQNARVAGLQSSVNQAVQAGSKATAGSIQSMGGQQATAQGGIALQAAQTAVARQGQVGAMGLQEQFMANQQDLVNKKNGLSQENQQLTDKLASLNLGVKQELIDKQTQFAQDEMGRTLFTDRQLMDYQLQSAKSQQDLAAYETLVQDASQKRTAMLKQSYAVINQAMTQSSDSANQLMNEQQKQQLLAAQQAIQLKMKQEAAQQKARAAMFQAGGAIVGGIIGTVAGGQTIAGAAIGAGVGTAVAGATQSNS